MKQFCLLALCLIFAKPVLAAKDSSDIWQGTKLSDESIENIQKAKYKYMQCITSEVQKQTYVKMDTRIATDKILQHCEKYLGHVKTVLQQEKVPDAINVRYQKQIRTQTARMVLQQLMLEAASRTAGNKP